MFESAELGHKIKKSLYEKEVPPLREALLSIQMELAESARFPVIILIGGLDGAGRGITVNLLNEWIGFTSYPDPRYGRAL
jgi:AMP-polyphosphate phosphotransferase